MKIRAFVHGPLVPELRPARARRDWVDAFPERHAYRCLPLAIANSFGWEVASPCDLRIDYDGGEGAEAIRISAEDDYPLVGQLAASNFTRGIVTLHTGYVFRTDPGWALLVSGPANEPKDGMHALTGVVETDWLPYPFTMNWQLLRPGTFRFRRGEPFCNIVPVLLDPVAETEVEILDAKEEPNLKERMDGFAARRGKLISDSRSPDLAVTRQAWGREYFKGMLADGTMAMNHVHKLRLAEPVDRRPPPEEAPPAPVRSGLIVSKSLVIDTTAPDGAYLVRRRPGDSEGDSSA